MARQTIVTGTLANDGTGDSLRVAGTKINSNFLELYNVTNNLPLSARTGNYSDLVGKPTIPIDVSDLTDTGGFFRNISVNQQGIYPSQTESFDLGTSALHWNTLYATSIYNLGSYNFNLVADRTVEIRGGDGLAAGSEGINLVAESDTNINATGNQFIVTTTGSINHTSPSIVLNSTLPVDATAAGIKGNVVGVNGTILVNHIDEKVTAPGVETQLVALRSLQPGTSNYETVITLQQVTDATAVGFTYNLEIANTLQSTPEIKLIGGDNGNGDRAKLYLGGIYNLADNIDPIQPPGVNEVYRWSKAWLEELDVLGDVDFGANINAVGSIYGNYLSISTDFQFGGSGIIYGDLNIQGDCQLDSDVSISGTLNVTNGINGYISTDSLKSIVSASTSFEDFQARIAAL